MSTSATSSAVLPFSELNRDSVSWAGGKGANLGELTAAGVPVPGGFVVGATAYAEFCDASDLRSRIEERFAAVDPEHTSELEAAAADARAMVAGAPVPAQIEDQIREAYRELTGDAVASVAVRSSATAEDTESASFAGMNETFLNVRGADQVVDAVRRCWASLFGARTIYYRAKRGFGLADVDIAVVVQTQIQSVAAGVMFTIDPAGGAQDQIVIEGAFGLGESVVSGSVSPDRFVVAKGTGAILVREIRTKEIAIESLADGGTNVRELSGSEAHAPVLADDQVAELALMGEQIESHYGAPQDTEWAIDSDGKLWMLQSRPITAVGMADAGGGRPAAGGAELVHGLGAAPGIAGGAVRKITDLAGADALEAGEVLVTHMTAPDWVPLMRRAAAIVTDTGGMTCHAAIVSRELGIPCLVGTTDATKKLRDGEEVTVDAGAGVVTAGLPAAAATAPATAAVTAAAAPAPVTATKLLVNLSEPSVLERAAALDVDGVGLLRAELMIVEALEGVHPRKLISEGRSEEFVSKLTASLTRFASAFAPRPITYRTIDFRSNEFRGLEGGEEHEPVEANPMIGYRGALRYMREPDLIRLELEAIAAVHDAGHDNLHVMVPFVRTARELVAFREVAAEAGLLAKPNFELWIMAEVPSVLFSLERYAELGVRGISIGSNDLTQLLLGADRDSELVAEVFDERDPAVIAYIGELIAKARSLGLHTSICGQAPSVHPEYAEVLVRAGIDAISVNIDAVDRARRLVAAAERKLVLEAARRAPA